MSKDKDAWSWDAFLGKVVSLAASLHVSKLLQEDVEEVRMGRIEDFEGAYFEHVLLINLGEGSFPSRRAVEMLESEMEQGNDSSEQAAHLPRSTAYSQDMNTFLSVAKAANHSLTLTYPNVDAKGRRMLKAGFLDELGRIFALDAKPAFPLPSKLASSSRSVLTSTADLRIRELTNALAGDLAELEEIAKLRRHREALEGSAAAILVSHARRLGSFGKYDGLIKSKKALAFINSRFGPEQLLSPSQIETYSYCPFQFFSKYVLRLEPNDEHDPLTSDRTERGNLVHRILELVLHSVKNLEVQDQARLTEHFLLQITPAADQVLGERKPGDELEAGMNRIEGEIVRSSLDRFASQAQQFVRKNTEPLVPKYAEWSFDQSNDSTELGDELVLGTGTTKVRLRGKVDRVDVLEEDDRLLFRVIDYKTGKGFKPRDLLAGVALQLPLYAMAFEKWARKQSGSAPPSPLGFGYWSIKDKGYADVYKLGDEEKREERWRNLKQEVEKLAVELAGRLRAGEFPVFSKDEGCTSACEYSTICRVSQVRRAGKDWNSPHLDLELLE